MRGEGAPSPIYEGEDSVVARILDGKKALYKIPLPKKNEEKKAILETYTKEYSAEYQAQALIDLDLSVLVLDIQQNILLYRFRVLLSFLHSFLVKEFYITPFFHLIFLLRHYLLLHI